MSTVIDFPDREKLSSTVAANVRAQAARLRFNQTSLAKALGMSRSSVADKCPYPPCDYCQGCTCPIWEADDYYGWQACPLHGPAVVS